MLFFFFFTCCFVHKIERFLEPSLTTNQRDSKILIFLETCLRIPPKSLNLLWVLRFWRDSKNSFYKSSNLRIHFDSKILEGF